MFCVLCVVSSVLCLSVCLYLSLPPTTKPSLSPSSFSSPSSIFTVGHRKISNRDPVELKGLNHVREAAQKSKSSSEGRTEHPSEGKGMPCIPGLTVQCLQATGGHPSCSSRQGSWPVPISAKQRLEDHAPEQEEWDESQAPEGSSSGVTHPAWCLYGHRESNRSFLCIIMVKYLYLFRICFYRIFFVIFFVIQIKRFPK